MTLLFTADWHIKLGQKNVPREWAIERYYEFFNQIYTLEKEVDAHIIGGDIFDRIPTMEELGLYFEFVTNCEIPTYIYDGNHEATKKGQTFLSNLALATNKVNPLVQIITIPKKDMILGNMKFNLLPYCELHNDLAIEKMNPILPLFTHVRGEIPPHVKPEIPLSKLAKFPVVFAGDLHSHSNCQRNIVYPGSPMTTTFHRTKVSTGYIIIYEDWDWTWGEFDLPQLLRKKVKSTKEMVPGKRDHIIYEIEGDIDELAKVEHNELLDKKIVKRQMEAALILDKSMTIEEELTEYLLYILEIPEERVTEIVGTFHDYA
ncbi:MAG TPA: metallophosphoesterase [Thermodesulfobacteriota bacterium]|nr:metallophosphoesterase [Thermodesulfobacteriota bacterium]